ncbi:MAG: hypothetical protein ACREL3_07845 [Gemmatimonadales bacterium]
MHRLPIRLGAATLAVITALSPAHAQMAMMHGHNPNAALHLEMTPGRAATAADSARADSIISALRPALEPYRDVGRAIADGYRVFLPQVPQQVYHFTSWRRSILSAFHFDPTRPGTLLYRRTVGGGWELAGAMYSAPGRTSLASLDSRVPLGVAHWHRHVNWCLPPRGERRRWKETRSGAPLFGPLSPIATRQACEAVGGVFHPALFGWMVHVDPYAPSPSARWGEGH